MKVFLIVLGVIAVVVLTAMLIFWQQNHERR